MDNEKTIGEPRVSLSRVNEAYVPPTLEELYQYLIQNLYRAGERCSLNENVIRFQDNNDGILVHITQDEVDAFLNIKLWLLPRLKSDNVMRIVEHSELLLCVSEMEPHQIEDRLDLSNSIYEKWTVADITLKVKQVMRRHSLNRNTQKILERIPNLEFESYGGMVPFQAYGIWDGWDFYFRYRGGMATLSLGYWGDEGPNKDAIDLCLAPYWYASKAYGDPMEGCLDMEEFFTLFVELATNLGDGWFNYKFKEILGDEILGVSANSREEAINLLIKEECARKKLYSRTPKHEDSRIFPAIRPAFLVLAALD